MEILPSKLQTSVMEWENSKEVASLVSASHISFVMMMNIKRLGKARPVHEHTDIHETNPNTLLMEKLLDPTQPAS